MTKPLLPSQQHPEYPRTRLIGNQPVPTYRMPKPQEILEFYRQHPEFKNEGDYKLICPYCGDENFHSDIMGACCHEVGHCEWVYFPQEDA